MHSSQSRNFWLRSQLDLAEHVLAIMHELTALKTRVHALETSKPAPPPAPQRVSIMKRALAVLRVWGRFLQTKEGQGLVAIIGTGLSWLGKWLWGGS